MKTTKLLLFAFGVAVAFLSSTGGRALNAAEIVANVGIDYIAGTTVGDTSTSVGIVDTAGTGSWDFLQAGGGGSSPSLLTWQLIGNEGNFGYGGTGDTDYHLPALTQNKLFPGGAAPLPDRVNLHPAFNQPREVIARWTAGESGLMNIAGSFDQNGGNGNIGFAVRVNGSDVFSGTTTREDGFSFLQQVAVGDTVDFVVGPNGARGNDESQLTARATRLSGPVIANLGADYTTGTIGQTSQQIGITDTAGSGSWNYYESDNINIDVTANEQLLTFGSAGNAGGVGFGGSGARNLAAISDDHTLGDGEVPLADELSVHPSDHATLQYAVMRWTAGSDVTEQINIVGNLNNGIPLHSSVDFHILVDGEELFSVAAADGENVLPITFFDFLADVAPGSTVDFVLGRNGTNYQADETRLSAFITQVANPVPEPATLVLLGLGGLGMGLIVRRRK